jgi:hypothetical protein
MGMERPGPSDSGCRGGICWRATAREHHQHQHQRHHASTTTTSTTSNTGLGMGGRAHTLREEASAATHDRSEEQGAGGARNRRERGARCEWGTRWAGERSKERTAHMGHATGGSEERASGAGWRVWWEKAGIATRVKRGVRMGQTAVAKHYRFYFLFLKSRAYASLCPL